MSICLVENLVVDCPGREKRKNRIRRKINWLQISTQSSKKVHQELCPFAVSTRRRFFVEVILAAHDARAMKLEEDSDG